MKKFSKILEEVKSNKTYKIKAEIELIVDAESSGEAGYLGDSILGGIEEQFTYTIQNIEETEDSILESGVEFNTSKYGMNAPEENRSDKENILLMWEAEFGDKTPPTNQKLEWYHQMRNNGYDGITIFKVLKNKI